MNEPADQAYASRASAPGWRMVDAFIGLVLVFFVFNVGLAVLLLTAGDGAAARLAMQGLLAVVLVGVAIGYAVAGSAEGETWRALGFRRPRRGWMGLTILALIGFFCFSAAFSILIAPPEQVDVADELGVHVSVVSAVVAGFLIVVAAPLAEEIFFRGFFYGGLRKSMPFLPAALISGVLFGAIHLAGGNLPVGALLSVLGVLLAWLYERTGSIWSPIALHAINNAFAFSFLVAS